MPWPEPDEWPGPPCYCGRTGCIETFLSGPGMSRDHPVATGERLDASAIAARAAAGDADACGDAGRATSSRLARGLASIINVVDPDVIVLGGGVSNIDRLYERVPALWEPFVFSDHVATRARQGATRRLERGARRRVAVVAEDLSARMWRT